MKKLMDKNNDLGKLRNKYKFIEAKMFLVQ